METKTPQWKEVSKYDCSWEENEKCTWWIMPIIPALGNLRQEDICEFETNLR